MMCDLPFVPEDIILTAWKHLKPPIPSEMSSFVDYYEYSWVGSSNRNPTFSHYYEYTWVGSSNRNPTFSHYYEYTWVGSSNRNPTFSHYRWNQHDVTSLLLPRCNIAEGWHHGFKSMFPCQNPSIWKFLECLKKEQSLTEVKMTKMMVKRKLKQDWRNGGGTTKDSRG